MKNNNIFGTLACDGTTIRYESAAVTWALAVADIKLIAEYTASVGPFVEDYFFVFMTSRDAECFQASFYARGRDEALANLAVALGGPIETGLGNAADLKSRILWPPYLSNHPLGDMREVNGKTVFELTPAAKGRFR